jgi:hypothetical protein
VVNQSLVLRINTYLPAGRFVLKIATFAAMIVNPNMNEETLKNLATTLKLRDLWSYEAKVLKEKLDLETKEAGEAFVIQDDFQNSYQKIRK